jgi:tetratricopeptide (TPR) repeat protein
MSPDTAYDQLSAEDAAEIDAVCDRFEQAWREMRAGGPVPRVTPFLGQREGPARAVLLRELMALQRACRERYGPAPGLTDIQPPAAAGAPPESAPPESAPPESAPPESAPPAGATPPQAPTWAGRRAALPWGPMADCPFIAGLEILEVLGSGGMGVVYRARQATLDREVAVKVLRDAHRSDPGHRERFLQEARALARLRHPHLVQVYEFGEAAGGFESRPYLVLEYVAGGSLADLLRGAPQPPAEAARLVETLADAIHYAHQQGVIHRDLKPANVLLQGAQPTQDEPTEVIRGPRPPPPPRLGAEVCAKVTDFGLAKFLTGSDLTQHGEVLGTPCYMAPEQAAGRACPLTQAVDVYGLGAILYETLTGRPPFAAATPEATLALVRADEPVPPRRLQPTVPRDLETICLKCLRKDPGRRYATARDLADDLRRFRAGEPIHARPVSGGERLVGWCRRNPGVAMLVAALVVVFVAGVGGVLWQWQCARDNAANAERNATAYQRERDTAREQKARAERRLALVRNRVDQLKHLGRDLLQRGGQHRAGQAVLEEALAFYQEMLPDEGRDPAVRREAAQLYRQVAEIHFYLGQPAKAAADFERQATLLASLLDEDPGDKALRLELADTHRWRANMLRDLGKNRQSREAYDEATRLHEALLREDPNQPHYQVGLANTLLNTATLLSPHDHADELEALFRRAIELDRAAVAAAPGEPLFRTELALALEGQGEFFLDTGRGRQAEACVSEALEIQRKLLTDGLLRGPSRRYLARTLVGLGQVFAATGRAPQAEHYYREAATLLRQTVEQWPESALCRTDLAATLVVLADALKDPDRRREAEEVRRRAIRHYERLTADFPEQPHHRLRLARAYLALAELLSRCGRHDETGEILERAFEADPGNPTINDRLAWFLATTPEVALRDHALAVRLAQKAVDAKPRCAEHHTTLGVCHYRQGDYAAAIAALEAALELRGASDGTDWLFLAMAHCRLGHHATARACLERGVQWLDRLQPRDEELLRFRAEAEVLLAEAPPP